MAIPVPGPEGFLLSPDDPLRAAHLRLNDYLLAEEQRNNARTPFDVTVWRKLPKRELVDQVQAILLRLEWLDQHDSELQSAHLARIRLATLLRVLHRVKIPYTEPNLCKLLDVTRRLLGRISPYGPVERVMEYLKDNDLTPELCHALRQFQGNLREEMSVSQASMQSLRQCLHMLLWLDEWEPLDPERCWSECIRRDFRALTGDRRLKWRRLLKHLRGNAPVRMPAGWARQAETLLDAVGLDDFREHITSRLSGCAALGNSSFLLALSPAHVLHAGRQRGEYPNAGDEAAAWSLEAQHHGPIHARTRGSKTRGRAEDREPDSLSAQEGEWRMKFLIQMWPNVAYRSVGREANLLKRLVDLEGFEPSTS